MLRITNLVKRYSASAREARNSRGERVNAVDGITFSVEQGEFFTLLGPSGCGKTTTLRSIAGLEEPDSGSITLSGTTLFDGALRINVPASRRGLAMVFQSYAIWPHMTVYRNVAFPLEVMPRRNRPKASLVREKVNRALDTVGLSDFAGRPATALSGGQQQRLALARALVADPSVVLLDEPLSNLDAKLRESMRMELKRLQRDMGVTTVYVTHDQAEALSFSNRIAVMASGRIVQLGKPREIYGKPGSQFVADFLGGSNFFDATVISQDSSGTRLDTSLGPLWAQTSAAYPAGTRMAVCLRPEQIQISGERPAGPGPNHFEGKLATAAFLGDRVDFMVSVGDVELRVRAHPELTFHRDSTVYLTVDQRQVVLLDSGL
jgi:iron(III) transport system ATP-binding protein